MKSHVVVVFGGQSTEHDVSCLTAAGVLSAVDTEKYDISTIGITKDGRWCRIPVADAMKLKTENGVLPHVEDHYPEAVLSRTSSGVELATKVGDNLSDKVLVDVAFPVLHGPFGEDGTIQGMFEMLGLRYVGAGVMTSAVSMDKHIAKMILEASGIPVCPYRIIHPYEWPSQQDRILAEINELEFPVFVKPARGGSSVGISKIDDPSGLVAAIDEARKHDPKVLVEQGVVGAREIECAVLEGQDGNPRVSKLGEIAMVDPNSFYDYQAKYLPEEQVILSVPARVTAELEAKVHDIAKRTFLAVGCEGLSRIDTFVTKEGKVIVNELNTMPGFTQFSMFPQLWEETGIPYSQLITELIDLALARPVGLR